MEPTEKDRDLFETARRASSLATSRSEIDGDGSSDSLKPVQKIKYVHIGKWRIETWYAAPYPEEYNQQPNLHLCEYCLKYMMSPFMMQRHNLKCVLRSPPGNEIYRDGNISIFEIYCQNLCLLAKMFLDHKTLYYDVEPFLFYVLTESDENGFHFVGYFSKEKRSSANYNLSCILTLPIHQRKGYGNFLIEFSYLLSRKELKFGSPEKPLSDLGLLSYRRYWRTQIIQEIVKCDGEQISFTDLQKNTGMTYDDIVATLANLELIVKDQDGQYVIRCNHELLQSYLDNLTSKGYPVVKPNNLIWTPFMSKQIIPPAHFSQ